MSNELNDGIIRQFSVMQRMLVELPETIAKPLLEQLNAIIEALHTRDKSVREHVTSQLDDVRLDILTMEFDLVATRNEKKRLEAKLRDAGLG